MEALRPHQSASAIQKRLADANPTVTQFQSDLARSQNNIGALLDDFGRLAEAINAHESAVAILQKLADANPTVIEFQSNLSRTTTTLRFS